LSNSSPFTCVFRYDFSIKLPEYQRALSCIAYNSLIADEYIYICIFAALIINSINMKKYVNFLMLAIMAIEDDKSDNMKQSLISKNLLNKRRPVVAKKMANK